MWLLCVKLLSQLLLSASITNHCQLHEKWTPLGPGKLPMTGIDEIFDEIYRPNNHTEPMSYIVRLDMIHHPFILTIVRMEYQRDRFCYEFEESQWLVQNMSFLSARRVGCSFHLDWSTVLVYFSDNFTLGIITDCSGPSYVRHVLYSERLSNQTIPTKTEVHELVVRYEKDYIKLSGRNEGYQTFLQSDAIEICRCPNNHTGFNQKIDPFIDYWYYTCMAIILFLLVIVLWCKF